MNFIDTLSEKFNIKLNEQQQKAVQHRNGPALVLAGPGSGKTTVITARTAYLCIEAGVSPHRILSVTYSRASARDMKERFESLYGGIIEGHVCFSTLHSFCNRIVMEYEKQQGQSFVRLTDRSKGESQHSILQKIYRELNGARIGDDELEDLVRAIGLVKNKMLKNPELLSSDISNFTELYKRYEKYKRERLFIDFDDMLTYAYIILKKSPAILNKYRRWYQYIQLDEGQDASKIQFAIISRLMGGNKPNLFVVADDDQSIYGFRGAEPREILNLQKRYPECKIFKLEKNYRSTQNIVKISSQFIKSNTARYDKQHKTDNKPSCDPVILRCKDERSQLLYVLDKIKEQAEKSPDSTAAVLYRNNLTSVPLVDLLDRNGIPFKLREAKMSFFHHWVVLDVTAILQFSLNQTDAEALKQFYYKINRYLSKNIVEYAVSAEHTDSLLDAIADYPSLKDFQRKKMKNLKIEFTTLSKMAAENSLRFIQDGFKYKDYINKFSGMMHTSSEYALEIFEILIEIAHGCDSVASFLQRIEMLEQIYAGGRHKSKLTLSTLHSSKGLEFDTVFMINLTNDETPGKEVVDNPDENMDTLEEERRLFYVGMTRARKNLFLMFPEKAGGSQKSPSIFVKETAKCMGTENKLFPQKPKSSINDAVVNKNNSKNIKAEKGLVIVHNTFGQGIISSVDYEGKYILVDIKFRDKNRILDWNACIEGSLIKAIYR